MACALCGNETADDLGLCEECRRLSETHTREKRFPSDSGIRRSPALAFSPGEAFGPRYTIVEEVGYGGMGQVYKALDSRLAKTVALKLVRPDVAAGSSSIERFRRELALAQEVSHPNVCRVFDLGRVGEIYYISMEYIEGQTLDDLIHAVDRLSPRQTVGIARQVCAGLQAVHDRGIIHRDLKPGNIMVDRFGRARLMDFGIAYHPDVRPLTGAGAVLGTLSYLSPEQARGEPADVRSDIYSLGVILFEMLTGRKPPGDDAELPWALRTTSEPCPGPSTLAPETPRALDAVVLRCLDREPKNRFPSVSVLDEALKEVAGGLSSGVHETSPPPPQSRNTRLLIVTGLLIVAVGALVGRGLFSKNAASGAKSLALLPLTYEGPSEQAFLKDLLPLIFEETLRPADGQVVSFATSRVFGPGEDPRAVASQLGVDSVLHGAVAVQGERVTATLKLFRADGRGWSKTLSSSLRSVTADADTFAQELSATILGRSRTPSPPRGHDPTALRLYLSGKSFLEGWDVDKNYERAESALAGAISADGGFAEAHAALALALKIRYDSTQEAHLVERALAEAQKAVSLSPSLPEARVALGVVQLWKGLSAEAAESFERAQQLAPADDAVCRHIADAYFALGRDAEAEKLYERAIELRPLFWDNYNAKGKFYVQKGQQDRAKEMFSKVIELRPQSNTGYNNKAASHLAQGELKEAEPLLIAALRIKDEPQLHNNLGFVYYGTARFEDAAREFRTAVDSGYQQLETYGGLGDSYRQLGRSLQARQAYEQAIELGRTRLKVNPNDSSSRAGMAMFLAGSGQCPDARREIVRAAVGPTDAPVVHYYSAVAYALCRDHALSVQETAKAIAGGFMADVRTNPDLRAIRAETPIRELLR